MQHKCIYALSIFFVQLYLLYIYAVLLLITRNRHIVFAHTNKSNFDQSH
jgi:hypothetical protein